jgi:hypothetical protein
MPDAYWTEDDCYKIVASPTAWIRSDTTLPLGP